MPDRRTPHLNAVPPPPPPPPPPPRRHAPHQVPQSAHVGRRPTGDGSATADIFGALAIAASLALVATVAVGVAIPVGLLPLGALAAFTLIAGLRDRFASPAPAHATGRRRRTRPSRYGSGKAWLRERRRDSVGRSGTEFAATIDLAGRPAFLDPGPPTRSYAC
jgi:hypothetical protein